MPLDRRRIAANFGRAAAGYVRHGRVQAEVGSRLLERLDGLRFEPQTVLDLGCGPGIQAARLKRRFRGARVVAMDLAVPMLWQLRQRRGWFGPRVEAVAGDAEALPLVPASVDLLFSSLMLQWCPNLSSVLAGFRRVLRPGGLLLISSFGPDTLRELRSAWADADEQPHTGTFFDVQTMGDALVRAGFCEPVLDTDWLEYRYRSVTELIDELRGIGATLALTERRKSLTGKDRFKRMLEAYRRLRCEDGFYPATWEVVYASAWAPEEGVPVRTAFGEQASVSVHNIQVRRR